MKKNKVTAFLNYSSPSQTRLVLTFSYQGPIISNYVTQGSSPGRILFLPFCGGLTPRCRKDPLLKWRGLPRDIHLARQLKLSNPFLIPGRRSLLEQILSILELASLKSLHREFLISPRA